MLERNELYNRINLRCDEMLNEGLINEVKSLQDFKHLAALQTVGYNEFFDYLDGKISYENAIELFKQHTRNYAKRQITWLKKEEDLKCFKPDDYQNILAFVVENLSN